jgi:hypothetical protein
MIAFFLYYRVVRLGIEVSVSFFFPEFRQTAGSGM